MIAAFIYELERDLIDAGLDYNSAHHMAWQMQDIVEMGVSEILNAKMADAMEYAASIRADEFIESADVVDLGNHYEIASLTGKTDFSTDARRMLPGLLKNAKVAKDGSLYQSIPIGGSSKSSFDRDAAVANAARAARENARNGGKRDVTGETRSIYQSQLNNRPTVHRNAETFRTATSKQDSATQWVYPAQEKDMTDFLHELNEQMNQEILVFLATVRESAMERV